MTTCVHNHGEPRGVGGWLAFLIFVLCVFVPLTLTYGQYSDMAHAEQFYPQFVDSPHWLMMKTIRWWATGAVVASAMSSGLLLLFMRNARTRYFAIAGIWLAFFVVPAVTWIVTNISLPYAGVTLFGFVKPLELIVGSVVTTAYLLMSKRVKNTYGDGDTPPSRLWRAASS